MRWGGPRSETTQFMSEVDRFLTGKSPKCLLSELSAALQ